MDWRKMKELGISVDGMWVSYGNNFPSNGGVSIARFSTNI